MKAVITADIVDYTSLTANKESVLLNNIHNMFSQISSIRTNIDNTLSIHRGDSIQGEISNPADGLRVALLLKTAVNKVLFDNNKKRSLVMDIRVAIGIGNIDIERDTVNESSGEAYIFSGRTLDVMKKTKQTIAIKTNNEEWNAELETEFKLLEEIIKNWQISSAEVVYWALLGFDDTSIAKEIGVSRSAIVQRKKTAGWTGIKALITRFETLMQNR